MSGAIEADVTVVGSGIVGATLACALRRGPLSVALLDAAPPRPYRANGYALRVSAINVASQRIFDHLDAWATMRRQRVSPFREISVWEHASGGAVHFRAADIGEPLLGHIVENDLIVQALHERLGTDAGVHIVQPAHLERIDNGADATTVVTAEGHSIRTRLVVGADGARSRVRGALGIGIRTSSYGQKAIVATVATERPHEQIARQCFLATGPLAFLPLADGTCSIVWSCDDARAAELSALDDAAFAAELGAAFEHRLGDIELRGKRGVFALERLHADSYIAERGAVVGDAAHVIHPLAGLGANLGILDAASLAEVLIGAAQEGSRDVGSQRPLRRYERWRRSENALVLALMDAFKSGFGSRAAAMVVLRHLALDTAEGVTPLNHALMRRAMGLAGDLPKLALQAGRPHGAAE